MIKNIGTGLLMWKLVLNVIKAYSMVRSVLNWKSKLLLSIAALQDFGCYSTLNLPITVGSHCLSFLKTSRMQKEPKAMCTRRHSAYGSIRQCLSYSRVSWSFFKIKWTDKSASLYEYKNETSLQNYYELQMKKRPWHSSIRNPCYIECIYLKKPKERRITRYVFLSFVTSHSCSTRTHSVSKKMNEGQRIYVCNGGIC